MRTYSIPPAVQEITDEWARRLPDGNCLGTLHDPIETALLCRAVSCRQHVTIEASAPSDSVDT